MPLFSSTVVVKSEWNTGRGRISKEKKCVPLFSSTTSCAVIYLTAKPTFRPLVVGNGSNALNATTRQNPHINSSLNPY